MAELPRQDNGALVEAVVGPHHDAPRWTWLRASAEALRLFAAGDRDIDPDSTLVAAAELEAMHDAIRDALRPAHPGSANTNSRDLRPARSTLAREQERLARDRAAQLALRRAARDIDAPDDNRPADIREAARRLRRRLRTLERAVLADMGKTDGRP